MSVAPHLAFTPIGTIESAIDEARGAPIQPSFATGQIGRVRVLPEFQPALADLDGFERVWLLYAFDRSSGWSPTVTPFLDVHPRGLFATRAPRRPNPIGLSCVKLKTLAPWGLEIEDVDILNGTPLLDIKPYIPRFDAHPSAMAGWFDASASERRVADDRFL